MIKGFSRDNLHQQIKPKSPEIPDLNEILRLHFSGDVSGAEAGYRKLIAAQTTNHVIYSNLAVICLNTNRLTEAIQLLRDSLQIQPNYAEAHNNLGNAFQAQQKLDDAIAAYRRAIEIQPNYAVAHNNLGNAFQAQQKLDDAIAAHCRAIKIQPNYAEAYYNLGNDFQVQQKLDDAIIKYRRAIEIQPDYAEAHHNLGNALQAQQKLDDAIIKYRRAIEIQPDYAEAYYNLGNALQAQQKLEDAIAAYRHAIEIQPDYIEAHYNLGMLLLLCGKFQQGWQEYDFRLLQKQIFVVPPTDMEKWEENFDFTGELILITEQGLGDTIQFSRYAQPLTARGMRVSIQCQSQLVELLESSGLYERVYSTETNPKSQNTEQRWFPLMSLPKVMGTNLDNVPSTAAYLNCEPNLVKKWQEKIGSNNYIIGIAWQGNPQTEQNNLRGRSFPLEKFKVLKDLSGITLVSLQKGFGSEQLAESDFRDKFVSCQSEISQSWDFQDTAAIIANCDLIITSDTSVAHLAGALGKPTWIALKNSPEWRWLLEREDSIWYRSLRLFRQTQDGDWAGVFDRIKKQLKSVLKGTSPLFSVTDVKTMTTNWGLSQDKLTQEMNSTPAEVLPDLNTIVSLHSSGNLSAAEAGYRQLIAAQTTSHLPYGNLATICQQTGRDEEAIALFLSALKIKPDAPATHTNLGNALKEQGQLEEAIAAHHRALAIKPDFTVAYYNLGNALKEYGKLDEAIVAYQQAIAIQPNYAQAYLNLGVALKAQGKFEQAIVAYRHAIQIQPDYIDAHKNLAMLLLFLGEFKQGWQEYDFRLSSQKTMIVPPAGIEKWDENFDFTGELILIAEQGLGDTIQFSRYGRSLTIRGMCVSIQCQSQLVQLLESSGLFHQVYSKEIAPKADNIEQRWFPLISIPRVVETMIDNVPCQEAYLDSDPNLVRKWQEKIGTKNYLIGIVWQGNPRVEQTDLRGRSFPLAQFKNLGDLSGITLLSLQKGFGSEQLDECEFQDKFVSCQAEINQTWDFQETAAIMSNCDLIITSDTSVAHLAGALGKPTWVALQNIPEWRWLLEREDSIWYRSIRLFRQHQDGDWASVFDRIQQQLKSVLKGASPLFPIGSKPELDLKMSTQPTAQPQTIKIQFLSPSRQHFLGIGWGMNTTTGWGNYGLNLVLQLQQMPDFEPALLVSSDISKDLNPLHRELLKPLLNRQQELQGILSKNQGKQIELNIPILESLGNNFTGGSLNIKGDRRIGVIFFENTKFSQDALEKAKQYDLIVTGSSWNAEVLQNHGLTNVRTILQGIDPTKFHPAPKSNLFKDRFVIFSGGKLEYRKGQDIVVAAFKRFIDRHPDALLLTAWHNFWPQFMEGIDRMNYVNGVPQVAANRSLHVKEWLVANGIPDRSCLDVGVISNYMMGQIVREADVAVFPNRGEGGTNLVAMECLACGIPTILSANTGHLDLLGDDHCYTLNHQSPVNPTRLFPSVEGWGESDVDEIVATLEQVYNQREESRQKATAATIFMQDWTWEKQIRRLGDLLTEFGIVS